MNDGDQALRFIYLIGVLVLVASGLFVRRAPIGQTLKMVLAWVLIFAAGFAIFALRDDFRALGGRIAAAAWGEGQEVRGSELRIPMDEDGHFWVDAELNGRPVRLLVDSGATVTTVSRATADRIGLTTGGFGVAAETGMGIAVDDRAGRAPLKIGPIERNIAIHVSRAGALDLLGMNFLSSLSAWRVEGRTLVLKS